MLIKLSEQDLKQFEQLVFVKDCNIAAAEAFFEFSFSSFKPTQIQQFLNLDLSKQDDIFFYTNYFSKPFKLLDKEKYIKNDFRQLIQNEIIHHNDYSLDICKIKAYQTLPYDDIEVDSDYFYMEKSNLGYFIEDFCYPAISKNENIWMSLDPNEINTMSIYVDKMFGNIIIFGLGLGYFAYLCSQNPHATSITIVENDEQIIDIFNKRIRPKLNIDIPFNIVYDDAFEFINKNNINAYDSAFMDIWHNPEDGAPLYFRFHQILKDYKGKAYYWLEKSLIAMIRRCLITIMQENIEGADEKNYHQYQNDIDRLINDLYFLTKKTQFNNYNDIYRFLSDENIKKIIS